MNVARPYAEVVMARFAICFLLASLAVQTWADEDTGIKEIRSKKDVEVAPDKWLTMDQVDRVLDEESPSVRRMPNRQAVEKMRRYRRLFSVKADLSGGKLVFC